MRSLRTFCGGRLQDGRRERLLCWAGTHVSGLGEVRFRGATLGGRWIEDGAVGAVMVGTGARMPSADTVGTLEVVAAKVPFTAGAGAKMIGAGAGAAGMRSRGRSASWEFGAGKLMGWAQREWRTGPRRGGPRRG